uniref:SH3 domain-containing protein n=1 Tax=Meloidogyne hapla TaxID=6305 RepID=A0A1I8BI29_MELHA
MPRHTDELRLDRGDAVHLNEKFNDHWCFGVNLRSGQRGIFPESLIVEIDLVDEICNSVLPETNHQMRLERDTFYLTMLASIEVAHHKGNDILVQAINKVLMEISFRGIHIIDKRKKDVIICCNLNKFSDRYFAAPHLTISTASRIFLFVVPIPKNYGSNIYS